MSARRKKARSGTLLELWRPPQGAGDPVGCLATTFTFTPGLFDEQCLARFLEIESEPNRDDLAFLLERETQLGGVYAGVLVDHRKAGVEHSLRWDVLPVRIRGGIQHAKVSLLAWSRHVRIIVASANLTEPGYRSNFEVAAEVNSTPAQARNDILADVVRFLGHLIDWVPGAQQGLPEVRRAQTFLSQVLDLTEGWKPARRAKAVRQTLVCTLPATGPDGLTRSSLQEAITQCRKRGGSPHEAWVASPFFDDPEGARYLSSQLCKSMVRGGNRKVRFCVPGSREGNGASPPRLSAPDTLVETPPNYGTSVSVRMLPQLDPDKNQRPWHAKMLALRGETYSGLLAGSSNFTCAGMGVRSHSNAEANLLTVIDWVAYAKEIGRLEAVWPEMERVDDPNDAEWIGSLPDDEEADREGAFLVPPGFLAATYQAGDERLITFRFDPPHLPEEWAIDAQGQGGGELLSSATWTETGQAEIVQIPWPSIQPPGRILVRWDEHEAFLPLNVEDRGALPAPSILEHMSSNDMLWILAATDPSAAFRAWAQTHAPSELFDVDLDSATPPDLDPLRRHSLEATFLHRIRRRARVLAQLRQNLERPVWGQQALEWRLRGFIGVQALAIRFGEELSPESASPDDALLALSDFMIVLREVDYKPKEGSLSKKEFDLVFQPFLRELAEEMSEAVAAHHEHVSEEVLDFWQRVLGLCRS